MRDLAMLFLSFPELKSEVGLVSDSLRGIGASAEEMITWLELVAQEIKTPNEDDEFN